MKTMMIISCFTVVKSNQKQNKKSLDELTEKLENLKKEDQRLRLYNIEYEKRTYTSAKFSDVSTGLEHISDAELLKIRRRWYIIKQDICLVTSQLQNSLTNTW